MKIAIAQLNYHIANFDANAEKIISAIRGAKNEYADLVIFSELSICGYPPRDLLEQRGFISRCEESIDKIAAECKGIAAVVGGPSVNYNPKGKMLYNTAFFLNNGKIQNTRFKTLLPTYDIFDEYRYFEPNTIFELVYFKGKKIALTICEDLWDNQPVENSFARNRLYLTSPMRRLMQHNPDFIINIAASPFSYTQDETREEVLLENAVNYGLPIFYVNQVGANTELIFDGGSMCVSEKGVIAGKLGFFKEGFNVFDLNDISKRETVKPGQPEPGYIERIHDALVMGVSDFFNKLNLKTATLGLSGGIDSAVTLVLAVRALGSDNVRVLLMPSKFSSQHSVDDAVKLAENLNVQYDIVNIQHSVDSFDKSLITLFEGTQRDVTEENIQARVRGTLLMALSNKFGHLLLNTSNKSEVAVGYGTLYGDMNGALSVLGDVYKSDVFKLARFMNKDSEVIPENTIIKPPSAELAPEQKDTDSLPDYSVLDKILYQYIELKMGEEELVKQGYDRNLIQKIIKLVNRNEFKRYQTPPILRISTKAFGMGRRMPIVANFKY